jgi:hypothetical protein
LRGLFIRETQLHEKRLWKKGYEFIFTPFPKKKKIFPVAAAASHEKLGRVGVGGQKLCARIKPWFCDSNFEHLPPHMENPAARGWWCACSHRIFFFFFLEKG